jgi:hypothetical protein
VLNIICLAAPFSLFVTQSVTYLITALCCQSFSILFWPSELKFLKGFCLLVSFFLALAYAVKKLFSFLTKCKHAAKTEVSFGFSISY